MLGFIVKGLQLSCLQGTKVFTSDVEPWQNLLHASDTFNRYPGFFSTPAWLDNWSQHLGKRHQYYTFVAEKDGEWLAVLPMMVAKVKLGRFSIPALLLASWPELDNFEIPAVNQEVRQALLDFALDTAAKNIKGWNILMMREISRDGPTHSALRDHCERKGIKLYQELRALTPVLDLREYHARTEKLPHKERSRLNKFERRIARLGPLESAFEIAQDSTFHALLDECADVEKRSWKAQAAEGVAFMLSPHKRKFVDALGQTLAPSGQFAVGLLRIDGTAVATDFGMVDHGRYLSYNTSFDQQHKTLGLGAVLLDRMIEAAPNLGIHTFDASRGSTDGQHILGNFGCPTRTQIIATFYRPTLSGAALRFTREVLRPRLTRSVMN